MRKVIGIGESVLDIVFRGDSVEGALAGGSVLNGLVSLGRAGVAVEFMSELGCDRVGEMVRGFMEGNGVSTASVLGVAGWRTPVSLAFLDGAGEAGYIFYKDRLGEVGERLLPCIERDDIFVFGSYYALDAGLRGWVVEALSYAKERGAIVYYDLNFRAAHGEEREKVRSAVIENLGYADIVRGSAEDCENLFGRGDLEGVYREEIQAYCSHFIGTRGAGGVEFYRGGGVGVARFVPSAISVVSAMGAGDSFNAGVIYGLLRYDVGGGDLGGLSEALWGEIIRCGMDWAREVCLSRENYISREFAAGYK